MLLLYVPRLGGLREYLRTDCVTQVSAHFSVLRKIMPGVLGLHRRIGHRRACQGDVSASDALAHTLTRGQPIDCENRPMLEGKGEEANMSVQEFIESREAGESAVKW